MAGAGANVAAQQRITHDTRASAVWSFALVVWAVVALRLGLTEHGLLALGFGDSDDATRLVMVRDLLHGQGWYDPAITRFQPPLGLVMHWSRLLDGVLAAVDRGLGALAGEAKGEALTRLLWPLALILPALTAGLSATRALAGPALARTALWAAAAACAVSLPLYAQFHPGRIDHHNVQIVLWLAAFAGAAGSGRDGRGLGGAILAGLATGAGLAVGLEALLLHAAIAGFLALRFVADPGEAKRLRAYALALLAATTAAFLVQTPPAQWGVSACDAIGLNLTAAVAAGAVGLGVASLAARRSAMQRLALVLAAGAFAAGVYVALNPACLHGPFAQMNPALHGVWLDQVQEVRSLPAELRADPPTGWTILAALVVGPLAWAACALEPTRRREPAWWLCGLMLAASGAAAFAMLRMSSYLFWAAVPPVATAAAALVARLARGARVEPARAVLAGLALTPTVFAAAPITAQAMTAPRAAAPPPPAAGPPGQCYAANAYAPLARLPKGRVLADPDLGPFILASTPHAAIAGPYHRMDVGILAAHAAFFAQAGDDAQRRTQALGVRYVVDCPAHGASSAPPGSLGAALSRGAPPAWLERVSRPGAVLTIWRVRPPPPA